MLPDCCPNATRTLIGGMALTLDARFGGPAQRCPHGETDAEGSADSAAPAGAAPRSLSPASETTRRGEAERFIRQFHAETSLPQTVLDERLRAVATALSERGTYLHTADELAYGARLSWRNSVRCVGRLRWRSLVVRDRREDRTAEEVFESVLGHIRQATNGGRIRSTMTVFAPDGPHGRRIRLWNEQYFRYAGWALRDGTVLGDPRMVGFTRMVANLGWRPAEYTRFTLLPLVIQVDDRPPAVFEIPDQDCLQVPIVHPEFAWFADLGLQWYALPAVSNMRLEIGGIDYSCAPFNGHYLGDEIASRNLSDPDRYNQLPVVARCMGLDTSSARTLWRERALLELNRAVLHSFDRARVTISDHHGEASKFMKFVRQEEAAQRTVRADWSWINSHLAPPLTETFFHYFDQTEVTPNLWLDDEALAHAQGSQTPSADSSRVPSAPGPS